MKYVNSVCDGCGLFLREDDDIVVCPECGTPQHRECYKKNHRCVNNHKHSEGFEWNSGSSPAPVQTSAETKQEEKLPCPSCGHKNPRDAKRCENCSMKLIVFGMNLAEDPEERRPHSESSGSLPDYEAPFNLGQGDGFSPQQSTQEPPLQPPCDENGYMPEQQTPYGYGAFPPPQQAPFSEQTQGRENARQFLIFRFIGANATKFITAFRKIDSKRGFTFNWAAFFFGPLWFFYRKLYKPGIIFLTLSTVISLIFTPSLNDFLAVCGPYAEALASDQAAYDAFMTVCRPYLPLVVSVYAANIAISLIAALVAYPLYKKYTESSVDKILTSSSAQYGLSLASKLGGTSVISALCCYFLTSVITSLVDMIMYGM